MKHPRHAILVAAALLLSACASAPLPVHGPGSIVKVADFETSAVLDGERAAVPKANVSATRNGAGAYSLHWKDAWYAALRVEGAPLDLRPYIPHGILALDVKVDQLARGGINFTIGCGKDCERSVPYVLPGRAMAGQGWRQLMFSMSCFVREGDDFSAVGMPFALNGTGAGEVAVANMRFLKSGTPNTDCPDYKTVSVTPGMLNESWSIEWWLPRHQAKLAEIARRRAANEHTQVVFIGDSITEGWEKDGLPVWNRYYKPLNGLALGFGGDRTENVLWRLQHGEIDGIAPKVAVLMFGTNNTGHRAENPATTAAGIKRNIEEVRQRLPGTRILLLAIFPRDEKPDGAARRINENINAILAGFADGRHVHFLNINQAFLAPDGTLPKSVMPDLLHPNEHGYELWAKAMAPELERLLK